MDMKNSEMAVRDLNTLVSSLQSSRTTSHRKTQVKVSDLASKDLLASSLDRFIASAKDASRHLTRLDSGVGGAVDSYGFFIPIASQG